MLPRDGPTNQIVGEHRPPELCGVGEEPSRGAVLETGSFLQISSGELHRHLDGDKVTLFWTDFVRIAAWP